MSVKLEAFNRFLIAILIIHFILTHVMDIKKAETG